MLPLLLLRVLIALSSSASTTKKKPSAVHALSQQQQQQPRRPRSPPSHWLRVIQINDVYQLDNLPRLKTLIDETTAMTTRSRKSNDNDDDCGSQSIDETLIVCAGDFLSPSVLSSMDEGKGMVDLFNAVGMTHVCLGNHEADVSPEALSQRIMQQSNFVWINTNMPELNNNNVEKTGIQTPAYVTISVGGSSRNQKRQQQQPKTVALLGLLTDDPSLYRPGGGGAFGNATIEPVIAATRSILETIQHDNDNAVDLIIPLTHQTMAQDCDLAKAFPGGQFPIICGGHDHEIWDETVAGNRIIKTGMDATHAALIDFQWYDNNSEDCEDGEDGDDDDDEKANNSTFSSSSSPLRVHVELIPTANFQPDPDLQQRVQGHYKIIEKLEQARLFRIADWMDNYGHNYKSNNKNSNKQSNHVIVPAFSTQHNRLGPSTGTTALATMLRMGMRAQCGIINAGAVRANTIYDHQEFFTWSDLKAEMPFSTDMVVQYIPGSVLEATMAQSRSGVTNHQDTKDASGTFLHGCSNIQFNEETMCIESIQGEPFDPKALYLTTLPVLLLGGLDNHKPLLDWVSSNQIAVDALKESALPAKLVVVQVFSTLLWLQLGSFDEIDGDGDGVIRPEDVKKRVLEVYGDDSVADLVVNGVFSVADLSNDGTITPLEMMIVQFCATDLVDHVCTEKELQTMKEIASRVLGKDPSHDQVKNMVLKIRDTVDRLDDNLDGLIHRDEVMRAVGDFDSEELDLLK